MYLIRGFLRPSRPLRAELCRTLLWVLAAAAHLQPEKKDECIIFADLHLTRDKFLRVCLF